MDTMECQHHNNCGGWCETEEEREMCLCYDCLGAYHEDEEREKYIIQLEKAMQRIAVAGGIELEQPSKIADIICARISPLSVTEKAIDLAIQYGAIDGEHHKTWVIDQMVRVLAGDAYNEIIADRKSGEDGPETYRWDIGIAP